jgi:hypothetical protein
MGLHRVTRMREPLATMPRCNAKAGTPSDAAKGKGVSWSKPTDLLLLQAPARLDVSPLSSLVRLDQPLPQFDWMGLCHVEVRSNLDHGRNHDQLS